MTSSIPRSITCCFSASAVLLASEHSKKAAGHDLAYGWRCSCRLYRARAVRCCAMDAVAMTDPARVPVRPLGQHLVRRYRLTDCRDDHVRMLGFIRLHRETVHEPLGSTSGLLAAISGTLRQTFRTPRYTGSCSRVPFLRVRRPRLRRLRGDAAPPLRVTTRWPIDDPSLP